MAEHIVHACPSCGKAYRLNAAAAGKRAKCKVCGSVFVVPSPTEPSGANMPPGGARIRAGASSKKQGPNGSTAAEDQIMQWLAQGEEEEEGEVAQQPRVVTAGDLAGGQGTSTAPRRTIPWRKVLGPPPPKKG